MFTFVGHRIWGCYVIENSSWGFYPQVENQKVHLLENRFQSLPSTASSLPRGLGRSYGDSCLNGNGLLIQSKKLDHYISFDKVSGTIRCEAGVSFDDILQLIVPHGWFLPITPGTKFVTVAGAIANDIHGKNHHQAGTFGHHVEYFELLRSNGERKICSRSENTDFFFATIGGLGLTGFITWVQFRLSPINSAWIVQEQIQFESLKEFFELSKSSEKTHQFTVSWVDCMSSADGVRGIFIRGNQASPRSEENFKVHKIKSLKKVPFFFPEWVLNKFSVKAFNDLYFRKTLGKVKIDLVHYDPFYYPLDSIHDWNRIYGARGFLQYQFVVPYKNDSAAALAEIFSILQKSQMGSFLAVLKTFGDKKSEGLLSFPREGVTLALDFPNFGPELYRVLEKCDQIVKTAQGAVYPAKDARMSKSSFEIFYPRVEEFTNFVDPQFSSSFWRRVR